MNIAFVLNGEDVSIDADGEVRLVDILRNSFNLAGTKSGCRTGKCGACSVLFNGDVVKSCLVPVFKIRGSEIITIEGFSKTDEYKDIARAMADAGVHSCGFCESGKIMAMAALVSRDTHPVKNDILAGFSGIRCRCTDPDALVRAAVAAIEYRRKKVYGRSS
ncbi:MAG: 2Fe-2S iron-sulfur cluster-binding protein [Treponema sp.]|nr:2Fe-2S iron-sulfur cluster-binding protein [Treponema sp.]